MLRVVRSIAPRFPRLAPRLFASLLTLAAACRTAPTGSEVSSLPDKYFVSVDAFQISSSFPLADDDPIARELVDLRLAMQSILHLAGSIRPIEIFIFDDRVRYDQFIQRNYPGLPRRRAFFMAQDDREIVYAFRDDKLIEDLRHEACHALLHSAVGTVPLWLDEGLAEYFETPGNAEGLHTRHVIELQAALKQGWRPSLTRLEGITQLRQLGARDYREAWSWAYWMLNDLPEGHQILLEYLQDIHDGHAREPLSARVFRVSGRPDMAVVGMIQRLPRTAGESTTPTLTGATERP
jgi:hypothetical protein